MQTVMEVQPMELSEGDLRNCVQVCISNLSDGCIILVCLLSTLALSEPKTQTYIRQHDTINCDYPWTLSCLARLWNVIAPKQCYFAGERLEQCVIIILETLKSVLDHVARLRYDLFLATKTTALLSQIICTFISPGLGYLTTALEGPLSSALLELARISAHSQQIVASFQENLLPVLINTKEDQSCWNALAVDLQVCSFWSAHSR